MNEERMSQFDIWEDFYMRRVGTISSAAGLIFLGVWMIISKTNPILGEEVYKWWPLVIVVLGIEVLLQFSKKGEERSRLNFLVIPVLLVLLCVNIYNGVKGGIGDIVRNIDIGNIPDINISGFDINNYKVVKTGKTIAAKGKQLIFYSDNVKLNIKKSVDENVRIEGDVYIDEDRAMDAYDIREDIEEDGLRVRIDEGFVKKVVLDIYIPDGYGLKVEAENLDIRGDDKFTQSAIDIKGENGNIRLASAASSQINMDNGNINLDNVRDIRVTVDNSNININGEAENINIKSDLGRIDIDNVKCSDINVEMDQGVVNLNTDDKNVELNVELDQGVTEVNESKFINAGSRVTLGTGTGKVRIVMDQGAVKFRN